jgi:hypothetical protein
LPYARLAGARTGHSLDDGQAGETILGNGFTGGSKIVESNDVELDDQVNAAVVTNPGNYVGLDDFDRESWSVDNPSTRIFTLRPEGISSIKIEIRYTRDEYWADGSDYHNAWDAYYIEKLPKALSDALFAFVFEAGTYVNRTLGHAMGENGPYRVDPRSPTKEDAKWVNDFHRECLEKRMNIRKQSGRGGRRRLDWPDERKILFLGVYETMKGHVKDAASRMRLKDPFQLRMSVLQASNSALPKAQRLPASTLHSLAKRADQIAVDRRSAPSLASLAMEAAAEKFGVQINDYLFKVLTSARKIRTEQHLGRANTKAANSHTN